MDKTKNDETKEERKKHQGNILGTVKYGIVSSIEEAKNKREAPLLDLLSFALAFLFARCHLVFGAHPLAIALLAILPSRVWLAVLGAACGSLTLGKSGIIYSMISVIVVFLRIIVSGAERRDDNEDKKYLQFFSESLLLKMSAAVIGGFVAAVYEVMLSGITPTTILFGLSMIIIPPLVAFALSGLFDNSISLHGIFDSSSKLLSTKGKGDKEKFDILFFKCSLNK